jgi:hypothetical protein
MVRKVPHGRANFKRAAARAVGMPDESLDIRVGGRKPGRTAIYEPAILQDVAIIGAAQRNVARSITLLDLSW